MSLQTKQTTELTFSSLGLSPKLLAILAKLHFTTPTPIQAQAIPVASRGEDIIGIAQTGTGKTLAFALPLITRIAQHKRQGLVLVPTRELAEQVAESFQQVGRTLNLRLALLIGGAPMGRQVRDIQRKPHVIIGTPGRINDHLERGTLKLHGVGGLVLDEADRMLDMGFAPQIKKIVRHVPATRQTMLFSATMPTAIVRLAAAYMKKPVRVEVTPPGTVVAKVSQELFIVQRDQKNRLLDKLLTECSGTVLVFSRTKYGAKKICRAMRSANHAVAEIHSNLSPAQRRRALAGFKTGTYRVLVATDIASRGIDVSDIELVVNYDLPDQLEDYVHRIGRTGRAGKAGRAISFVNPDQHHQIKLIERLVQKRLSVSRLPQLGVERAPERMVHKPARTVGRGKPHFAQPAGRASRGRRARVRI
ncbi:MAG TPA: DEAD/DEAH box helicase [Candidatus Andersenbacteria bacterium]|nr:DEAD/DEAH box helicase [Candidatus Andersenbacteria bacterium]